jgi:ribulose-phosphate 3-epimerase
MLNESRADWIHLDVMDGVFVPNISFGMPVAEAICRLTVKPIDTHFMVVEPDKFVDTFGVLGINIFTVHYEACPHLHRTLQHIRQRGMKAGVAINPHTPVGALEEIAVEADLLLIMSVNPGFGGQRFIEGSADKIARTKELVLRKNSSALIEVDGGITPDNAEQLKTAGADILVVGHSVFAVGEARGVIERLKEM